jgi:hypothetical protein
MLPAETVCDPAQRFWEMIRPEVTVVYVMIHDRGKRRNYSRCSDSARFAQVSQSLAVPESEHCSWSRLVRTSQCIFPQKLMASVL